MNSPRRTHRTASMPIKRHSSGYPIIAVTGIALLVVLVLVMFAVFQFQQTIAPIDKKMADDRNLPQSTELAQQLEACCDSDREQWSAAVEEFRAVSDRTTEIQSEEMPAYWRVLSWIREQPLEALRRRSSESATRQELLHHPDKLRGRLYKVDMQVCRVLPYEIPDNNSGVRQLYEVWGWTRDSGAWLSVVVTPDLPPGFPTGSTISESATLHGYFFKLQGYFEVGSPPRSQPLQAPMFLGRLEWNPQTQVTTTADSFLWPAAICLLFISIVVYRVFRFVQIARRRVATAPVYADRDAPLPADQWLKGIRQASSTSDVDQE